jgi:hypothetical protein
MEHLQTRLEALEQRTHPVEWQLRWWRSLGGPMTRAASGLLAAAVFLAGLLLAAPAGAQPPPIPIPTPEPFTLTGYCAFPVLVTDTAFSEFVIRETTADDGTTTIEIAGHVQATLTNTITGVSVSYNISGPGTIVVDPDGSFSVDAAGPNLFWTLPENLMNFPEVPTISYTTGHVTFTVDASGQTTAYDLAGHQTDVCAVLAP